MVGISPLWQDNTPVGRGVFYQEPALEPPGLWSHTSMAEMKFGSNFFAYSFGENEVATTYSSERSSSSGAYPYEEPEDDLSSILQEIHAYTCNTETEQLDITPSNVFHL